MSEAIDPGAAIPADRLADDAAAGARRPHATRAAEGGRPRIVLVHGIMDSSRIYRPMVRHLQATGIEALAPDLVPSHGSARLEMLAGQLADFIAAKIPAGERFHLLGFSMGALISRWYLQEMGGVGRALQFISVAAPHRGTAWSWLGPLPGMVQMRPGSDFMQQLEAGREALLAALPVTCYWTPFDLVIVPPDSGTLPGARNVSFNAWCHPCLLSHRPLMQAVSAQVLEFDHAEGLTA